MSHRAADRFERHHMMTLLVWSQMIFEWTQSLQISMRLFYLYFRRHKFRLWLQRLSSRTALQFFVLCMIWSWQVLFRCWCCDADVVVCIAIHTNLIVTPWWYPAMNICDMQPVSVIAKLHISTGVLTTFPRSSWTLLSRSALLIFGSEHLALPNAISQTLLWRRDRLLNVSRITLWFVASLASAHAMEPSHLNWLNWVFHATVE